MAPGDGVIAMKFQPTRPEVDDRTAEIRLEDAIEQFEKFRFEDALDSKQGDFDRTFEQLKSEIFELSRVDEGLRKDGVFFATKFQTAKAYTIFSLKTLLAHPCDEEVMYLAVGMLSIFRDVCVSLGKRRRAVDKKQELEQQRKARDEERAAEIALWLESQETPPEAPISLAERRAALANPAEGPTP